MGSNSNGDFGFEKRNGNFVNHQPSGSYLVMRSVPTSDVNCNPSPSSNGVDSFGTSWDPFVPMASLLERDLFPYSNLGGLENQVPTDTSHLLECSRVSPLGRGSFPDIVGPLDLSNCKQIAGALCTLDYRSNNKHEIEKISLNERSGNADLNEGCKRVGQEETNLQDTLISENGKKRKRIFDAQFDNIQNASTEKPNDVSQATKQKEQNVVAISRKPSTKEAKDHSQDGDSPKDDYIHIRARRGQATNSHSLAERVRREKISERMRYLQDLVPGCNKITGKAVMLDEIINYVQSLQRQVEFLSMKLAAVNPELNFDIDRILSKDVLNSRGSGSSILRVAPGMSSSHPHLLGPQQRNVQEEMVNQRIDNLEDVLKATNSQFSTMAQLSGVWDDELQNIIQQMGLRP